jgi:hypothetical protein
MLAAESNSCFPKDLQRHVQPQGDLIQIEDLARLPLKPGQQFTVWQDSNYRSINPTHSEQSNLSIREPPLVGYAGQIWQSIGDWVP